MGGWLGIVHYPFIRSWMKDVVVELMGKLREGRINSNIESHALRFVGKSRKLSCLIF